MFTHLDWRMTGSHYLTLFGWYLSDTYSLIITFHVIHEQ